jgi:putative redox protein
VPPDNARVYPLGAALRDRAAGRRILAHLRHLAQVPCPTPGYAYVQITEVFSQSPTKPSGLARPPALAERLLTSSVFPRGFPLEITLQHAGGSRFVAHARQHRVVIDQPAEDGATDQGMSPAELLLASLGSCIGQYVTQYLSLRGLSSEGLTVRVTAEHTHRPQRLRDFRVEIVAPELSERQLRALEKTSPAGLVKGALTGASDVRVTISSRLSGGVGA